ncbi:hypothetical protein AMATHDRAFT_59666 [Amanita thiersii Skay4041]|uniref:Arf-GAP domain-containing protein n=1 Tax=Amanita thiersii Skay4041 TaxID=703135 RepID=A0A2A9NPB4_9AGAR|nr:hypothetical protein AMATHDRAFT_59666 [Amanita thiersii Skay4041]
MSSLSKITIERNQRTLLELASKPGNDVCADCKSRNPRWASHNLGIFICLNCASIHRKIGTHITKVKSINLDAWTKEQVENMKVTGNVKSNAIYNPNEIRYPPPPATMDPESDSELEQYIRSKYQFRRFVDKAALVSLKLGSSRSTTTITPRSFSTPVVSQKPPTPTPKVPSSTSTSSTSAATSATTLAPQRPSALAGITPSRSISQPLQQTQPQQQTQQKVGPWQDLIGLQAPAANSSLPLQYQVPTATGQVFTSNIGLGTSSFSQPLQSVGALNNMSAYQNYPSQGAFASPANLMPPTPLSAMPIGSPVHVAPLMQQQQPQYQQQFIQPQPLSAGPTFVGSQGSLMQMQTNSMLSPSPVGYTTPSPALNTLLTPSPHLGTPSPVVNIVPSHSPQIPVSMASTGMLNGTMMTTGMPQMQMTYPVQTGLSYMSAGPNQAPFVAVNYQAQQGYGTTGQWGTL